MSIGHNMNFHIKDVRCNPRLHVSVDLLTGVRPLCCAMSSSLAGAWGRSRPFATAHLWCARYFLGTHVPRHVFQARAPSRNATRAQDLCVNLVCKYLCWMLGDLHFSFGRSLLFLILYITLKKKRNCTWEVLIISHMLFI